MGQTRRFKTDDIDKFFEYGLDLSTRTLYLGSASFDEDGEDIGVNGLLTERVIKGLHILDNADSKSDAGEKPITIIMNNVGGDEYHGLGIFDAITACKNFVEVKVFGHAMSMGSIILQAADRRVMSKNSRIMIHYGTWSYEGHAPTSYNWSEEGKRIDHWMEQLYLEKIKKSNGNSKFTLRKLREWLSVDTFLNAEEALQYGLIDDIL